MKREIAIWERTARLMPIVSLEDRAVRDALRAKAAEVKQQLNEAKSTRSVFSTCRQSNLHSEANLFKIKYIYSVCDFKITLSQIFELHNVFFLVKYAAIIIKITSFFFQISRQRSNMDIWQKNLMELEERYKISDYLLLIKSFSVLVVIIFLFFFSHFIPNIELELGECLVDK